MKTDHMIMDVYTPDETKSIAAIYQANEDMTPLMSQNFKRSFQHFVLDVLASERRLAMQRIGSIAVVYTSGQPYASAAQMRDEFNKTGTLYVSTDFNNNPLLPGRANLAFRAAHDLHHIRTPDCEFILDGEVCAYSKFAAYTQNRLYRVILFSEIVAQICVLRHTGEFPDQKIVYQPYEYIQKALDRYEVKS